MTREEAIVHIKDVICENNTIKPNMVVFEQEKEALNMAIKALEQEPCEDAVSREHLLSEIDKLIQSPWFNNGKDFYDDTITHYGYVERKEAVEIVRDLCVKTEPPVTPKQRTGHWEMPQLDDGMSDPIYYQVRCSECGFDLDPQTWHMELHQYGADKYCPNCGAKMEGERE